MEFLRVGIQHVGGTCGGWAGLDLPLFPFRPARAGGVVDADARLDVVDIDVEADALPLVLHAPGLHQHSAGHQIVPLIERGDPVEDVVGGLLHIVGHQVLKGQHALHIHVAGPGDQVALVGVLAGELEPDEVAAVIKVLTAVLHVDPAGGLHRADALPLPGRHQLLSHTGVGRAAAAQPVQRTVGLKGLGGIFLLPKEGLVVIDDHIGLARIGGHLVQIVADRRGGLPLAAGQQQGQEQQERKDASHRV